MTNSDPKSKIIELGKRTDGGSSQKIGELLSGCESRTINALSKALQGLFERVDDSLFDMAERADSNQVQTQYFDGMREIRRQRATVETEFKKQLSRGFREFASGHSAVPGDFEQSNSADGLSLIENDELEESLAISNMVSRVDTRLSSAMHALNERMGMVRGGGRCESGENPCGAQAIGYAFRKGAEHWDIEIRVRLMIFKLFEKHVLSQLPELYERLNQQLADAGVLPHLKFSIPRPRIPGAGAPGASAAIPADHTAGVAAEEFTEDLADQTPSLDAAQLERGPGDPEAAIEQQLFATMQSLLNARRGHQQRVMSAAPAYRPNDVLNALSALQNEVRQLSLPTTNDNFQAPMALPKAQLLSQIQEVSGNRDGALASNDEDAIDLVSMLFEYILQDSDLPSVIQATLARLQIPYLKVAVLDRHLFAQRSHPARQLLDSLARSGIGWSEDADRNEQLLNKIREIVDRVLKEFKDDLNLFTQLLEDFETFQNRTQRRSLAAEKRTTEATRGRERLLQARRQAAQEILARIGERSLPEIIRYLLTRPWANVLVLILLRQGDDSKEWEDSLRLVDELLLSCQPQDDEDGRLHLQRRLPWIQRQLRLGLRLVAMHEDDIDRQLEEVGRVHQRVLKGLPAIPDRVEQEHGEPFTPTPDGTDSEQPAIGESAEMRRSDQHQPPEPAPSNGTQERGNEDDTPSAAAIAEEEPEFAPRRGGGDRFVEEIILESSSETREEKVEDVDDEFTEKTRKLAVGSWVEFTDGNGEISRAKLSWVSPITHNYLFVNRNGIKVSDKSLNAMAIEFRRGTARVLEDVPLFDRALDAIVSRLRKDQTEAKD